MKKYAEGLLPSWQVIGALRAEEMQQDGTELQGRPARQTFCPDSKIADYESGSLKKLKFTFPYLRWSVSNGCSEKSTDFGCSRMKRVELCTAPEAITMSGILASHLRL